MNNLKHTMQRVGYALGLAAVLGAGSSAVQAATPQTWDFGYNAGGNGYYTSNDRRYVGSDGLGVTISGWAGRDDSSSSNLFEQSTALRHWGGGLGLDRYSSEEHTLDNNGYDELIAFVFDEAVALSGVRFGWWENDSDATIMYQTDAAAGFSGLGSTSIANLTSNGYSLLGNLDSPGTSASQVQGATSSAFSGPTQTGPVYSKVWLVGAYLRGISTANWQGYDGTWEGIKIKNLIAHRMPGTSVSVPATLALLALGVVGMRRRIA